VFRNELTFRKICSKTEHLTCLLWACGIEIVHGENREDDLKLAISKARATLETRGVIAHGSVSEAIANSWRRCLRHGLDPRGKPIDAAVSYQELREAKQRQEVLLGVVRPELELLSNQISGTNYLLAFANTRGVILDAVMDHEFQESECSRSVRNGTIWSEELRGTNGLGLALHTGETSAVTGAEHFLSDHAGVSCVAAPIFDSQGHIVGLLDASSEVTARQHHTQALVSLAATNIENRLFVNEHRTDTIIQFHPREEYLTTQSVGMVSADKDGRITGANRCACKLFNGLDFSDPKMFTDLFQGRFGSAVSQMRTGKIVRLVDWLDASYFARMRVSHPRVGQTSNHRSVALTTSAVFVVPSRTDDPVFNDESVRNSMRLAIRAGQAGLPICISGPRGSGRTSFARALHQKLQTGGPQIAIDCGQTNQVDQGRTFAKLMTDFDDRIGTLDQENGMFLIENLAEMRGDSADRIIQFVDRLLTTKPAWHIVSTETVGRDTDKPWSSEVHKAYQNLTQMKVHLPKLNARNDFVSVTTHILAEISSSHRLSNSALIMLQKIERPENLSDLANQLRLLVVHCSPGIIREEHIERNFGRPTQKGDVCARCQGNAVREAKCREINRVFKQCHSNVALTARTLNVSRNTVYSHITK
jgi:transcriptional regulator of acetoin/glycerol metabolism